MQAYSIRKTTLRGLFVLLRPRQWIKNGFVLAPLIFTGGFLDIQAVRAACTALVLFCLASSTAYILNDIIDRENDRIHPTKRKARPLASGEVTLIQAMLLLSLIYVLLIAGLAMQPELIWVILSYIALNLSYTFFLKHQPVLDIFCIALGFVLRVYAGATALSVHVSSWMFVTTLSLALYLAAVKRRQELIQSGTQSRKVLKKYSVALVERYAEMSASGAMVFYSLFVVSSQPKLVMSIPLVLFGLFRYWYVAEMQKSGESPTDALLTDWQLLATVTAWAGFCIWTLWPDGK